MIVVIDFFIENSVEVSNSYSKMMNFLMKSCSQGQENSNGGNFGVKSISVVDIGSIRSGKAFGKLTCLTFSRVVKSWRASCQKGKARKDRFSLVHNFFQRYTHFLRSGIPQCVYVLDVQHSLNSYSC